MKNHSIYSITPHLLPVVGLAIGLMLPQLSPAASVALATSPLVNSTTSSVQPNLLFVMDNSGSMGQDYTPDYLMTFGMRNAPWTNNGNWDSPNSLERNCKDSADDDGVINTALTSMDMCVVGDVPFMTAAINTQVYDPGIRYLPGVNADGSSRASQSTPTSVLTDGYNKHNQTQLGTATTTVNLTTSYPDRVWCTTRTPTVLQLTDTTVCRKNSDYLYPDATYQYGRDNNTTVTNKDVLGVVGAPYFYTVTPTEYCSEAELRNCTLSAIPTGIYTFPARSRWCNDTTLSSCQSVKTSTYLYPRYPGATGSAVAGSGSFQINSCSSGSKNITSIKVNGVEILGATVTGECSNSTKRNNFANALENQINLYVSSPDFSASSPSNTVSFLATVAGTAANGSVSITGSAAFGSIVHVTNGADSFTLPAYTFARTDIIPATTSYPKTVSRTDCAGVTCTYAEEITNFGNWYAYYRTRMQAMKSSASLAFKTIGTNFRVGFINICGNDYLPIAQFDSTTQKPNWYTNLLNSDPTTGCGTPLRSALSIAGRIFAGKEKSIAGSTSGTTIDPVQYSCQQNFTLLTTDGFWNGAGGLNLTGGAVGNYDGGTTPRPLKEGTSATSGTLGDIAKYYYDTDLRDPGLLNCTGSAGVDVCENNVFVSGDDNNVKQHMTTFSLGLGIDGTLAYTSDYRTATSGDFYNLKEGLGTPTVNWPTPTSDSASAVDDLWHAAVNGKGTYFSAKNPTELTGGLNSALVAIGSKIGAAAAAATSTLNPVAGNNFAYVASYATVKWQGNLESRSINIDTGEISEAATWCVENLTAGSCAAPSTIVADASGASTVYNCVTPSATLASCPAPGVLDGTDCKVEVPISCTGTMPAKIGTNSDTRTIYTNNGSGTLTDFAYANIPGAAAYFTGTGLSQWSSLTATQKIAAGGVNMVNFLRGQTGFEDRTSNTADDRLYRAREATMGDALESQPSFLSKPVFNYIDPGYDTFLAAQASRAGSVYIGANDGMMHSFASDTGIERWAYVPSQVVPNMWKLADQNYATLHTNFVNGSPTTSDICTANCSNALTAVWKTILIGGLNAGGKGYYALDITDPTTPILLWEFTTTSDSDVGFSYGQPIITKKLDGTWVALLTSGYNNTTGSNPGKGFLYVVNANTGAVISKIATSVGDATTPSGLAKVAAWSEDPSSNVAGFVYGGDLLGNLWRFDINAATVLKFAELKDPLGNPQPITNTPTLGLVANNRAVFIATGKYLEIPDLTDTQVQSLYAIRDDESNSTLINPRTILVEQTITVGTGIRTGSNNSVDFSSGRGWFIDFPDSGERANIDMRLVQGTLLVATIVPSNTVCSPGGFGWLNFFNYLTGGVLDAGSTVSLKYDATIVGINILYIQGDPIVEVVTSNNPTPQLPSTQPPFNSTTSSFTGTRALWRELIQ